MAKKVKRDFFGILVWGMVILIVVVGLAVKFGVEKVRVGEILTKFPDRGVPRINITLNGVSLEEINGGSKDEKYEGNEVTVYDGRKDAVEYGDVRVKGRGNGTWMQEKKPYQIKFSHKVDLFGMGKAKKWVLLANTTDATNLRTATAFYLEEMLGMKPALKGEFVELYFDDQYVGLYYLTHAVEIGKTSVDLRDPMGVLVELDNVYGMEEKNYATRNGEFLVVKDVVSLDNEEKAMESFLKSFNELELAIDEDDYERIEELVDIESFAKYYILSEFSVNPDAYWTSFYFYKDGVNDKIHAGPGWDFDLAFANRNWGNWMGEAFYSPTETMIRKGELLPKEFYDEMGIENGYEQSLILSRVMFDLAEMPDFNDEVKRIFVNTIAGRIDELIVKIMSDEELISRSAGFNGRIWGKDWDAAEVDDMMKWIKERYDYFESEYGFVQDN